MLPVTIANLRSVREAGRLVAFSTSALVLLGGGLVVAGLVRWGMDALLLRPVSTGTTTLETAALLWVVLRAFWGGCSAMTGTEVIANPVPTFRPLEGRNASITLGIVAAILAFLLPGVAAWDG